MSDSTQSVAEPTEVLISAVVLRAVPCGEHEEYDPYCEGCFNTPRKEEDLGEIAYWSKNPLKRFKWAAQQKLQKIKDN